jgi:hypothetical protein
MGKRLAMLAACVAVLAVMTVGIALAQTGRGAAPSIQTIHVVLPAIGGHTQFFDFANDGLTLGDRLAIVSPILSEDQTERVGTAYGDCWVGDAQLEDGSPYVCTYILKLQGGDVTTEGLDPHGSSDVPFAVTGGTGVYRGATGQAEYIDTDVTDIIIHLN